MQGSDFIMNEMVDEDLEFRGGTLQLSSDTGEPRSEDGRTLAPAPPVHPSVLSGVDSLSTSSSTFSGDALRPDAASDDADAPRTVYPRYDMPFSADNIKDYFTYRNGIVDSAIQECVTGLIFPDSDGELVGSWLLTEITLWDNEKERLVLLTTKMVITVKYDFIAMKKLDFKKTYLSDLDTIVVGELEYPPSSIVPRLNGLATGVTSVVRDCITEHWTKTKPPNESGEFKLFDPKYFEPRERNLRGIRIMWNKGQPLPLKTAWNPFSQDTPFLTFASHPVYWHKGSESVTERSIYDMESFAQSIVRVVEEAGNLDCCIHHDPIVIQSYLGIASLLHNKNSLGFFKVRVYKFFGFRDDGCCQSNVTVHRSCGALHHISDWTLQELHSPQKQPAMPEGYSEILVQHNPKNGISWYYTQNRRYSMENE